MGLKDKLAQKLAAKARMSNNPDQPKPRPRRTAAKPGSTPQSTDAEKAVLSAIIQTGNKLMYVAERKIGATGFFHAGHKLIWDSLRSLHMDNEPIDMVTITERLNEFGDLEKAGGAHYLADLGTSSIAIGNFEHYLNIVREKKLAREILDVAKTLQDEAIQPDVDPRTLLAAAKEHIETLDRRDVDDNTESYDFQSLADMEIKDDPNCVLGYRWLCKGGSCLFVGQSGIGKSSLAAQASMRWALGLDLWGVTPNKNRPLKSLFIQAENDKGDLAEMIQGVLRGYPRPDDMSEKELRDLLQERVHFHRDAVNTGSDFARNAQRLIEKHQPDLVWVDPLLSYAGDDISNQRVASQFLRNTLNPIALDTGIIWMLLHHTGKPSTDPKAKAHWNENDFAYAAFGSSELVNWARAVNVLRSVGEGRFELRFAKRGKRAGLLPYAAETVANPKFTDVVYLKHGDGTICWEQIIELTEEELTQRKRTKGKYQQTHTVDDLLELLKENNHGVTPNEFARIATQDIGMSRRTFYRMFPELKEHPHISKRDGRYYHLDL
jgi:hypothetical protein